MRQTTAQSDRPPSASSLSITLGVDRTAFATSATAGRSPFQIAVDFLRSPSARPAETQPTLVLASADADLILTEADFAPPEPVLPLLMRITGSIALAVTFGGAAYLAIG